MHCADCYSENMRMVGSISSPSWQCADCGSTKPPVHAHDKLPAEPEDEHHVSTEILETCKPSIIGVDAGEGMVGTGSFSTCSVCWNPIGTSIVLYDGWVYCRACAIKKGML